MTDPRRPGRRDARTLLVAFGSETGNAEDLAESLGDMGRRLRFSETRVEEMNAIGLSELLSHTLVIFVISTTGQGDLPRNALALWKKLLRKKLPPGCLARMDFTTFGLGDSSYPKYNWAARKLHKRLEQLGGREFYPCGEGDERHSDGIDTFWLPWSTDLRQKILALHPLPPGTLPIADHALLPARFPVTEAPSACRLSQPSLPLPIPSGIAATLSSNVRVTPASHFQDVRLLRLAATLPADTCIIPGDCVSIFPCNPGPAVSLVLSLQRAWPGADAPLVLPETLPTGLLSHKTTTLRFLLTYSLDITAVPRRSFFAAVAPLAGKDAHMEKLREFADPRYTDDLYNYTTRPRRTIAEALQEFDSVQIPLERVLQVFPALRGRDFSIANHVAEDAAAKQMERRVEIDILAAMVRYQTVLRKPRIGLCSSYLAPLEPLARLVIAHKRSPSPLAFSADRPVIAIAAGTGIAPLRALIEARHGSRHGPPDAARPRTVLFFGCRSKGADYYFADEWAATQGLEVFAAFSRDQKEKVYVQDALRRQSALVAGLVKQNAAVCLCGGSAKMAEACKNAVRDAVAKELGLDLHEAGRVVAKLDWWQEVWS